MVLQQTQVHDAVFFGVETKAKKKGTHLDEHRVHDEESLSVPGCYNPCWVQEELGTLGLRQTQVHDGVFSVETRADTCQKMKGTYHHARLECNEASVLVFDCYNPCWVQEELRIIGLQQTQVPNGVSGVETKVITKDLRHDAHCEDNTESLVVGDRTHAGFRKDASDSHSLVFLLKACTKRRDLHIGRRIHADIVERGLLEKNAFVGNTLVNMYAKCGTLDKAQVVFDELKVRDVVSWNSLIAGYAQHGQGEEALACFNLMQLGGFCPDAVTFVCILKACAVFGAPEKGREIHAQIIEDRSMLENAIVASALVDMYVKCDTIEKAQEVFDGLPFWDVGVWNALIAGYTQQTRREEALNCFQRMQLGGFSPNDVTFVCVLKACGSVGSVKEGQQIHTQIVSIGLLEEENHVGTALVDMYAKCGFLADAQEVFDELRVQDVVAWTALIIGYAQQEHGNEALECLERMQAEGFSPDAVTFACILKACSSVGAIDKGQEVHAQVMRAGLLEKNIVVGSVLVDMYVKCGALKKAQEVFDELLTRNVVSWNSLVAGYAQNGHDEEAVDYFERMQSEGFSPDAITFACTLDACGSLGAAYKGQNIHAEIVRDGLLEKDWVVGTALVDMYANCGMLAEAQEVFDKLLVQGLVSWNALMAGYAQLGKDEIVFYLYDKMIREGMEPDFVTLIILLNACSHKGLPEKGQMYFEMISKTHGIIPTLEHYNCLVDLFGRSGRLDKAVALIEEMSYRANVTLWRALLGACQRWGNMKLGAWIFEHVLDDQDAATHVCVSNLYAVAGRQ